jgi:hypothetical protein
LEVGWWAKKGCVKGGSPLVLTLDASLVLQQVEVDEVNSILFHKQM